MSNSILYILLIAIGIFVLYRFVLSIISDRTKQNDAIKEIANTINATKYYGNAYITFIGVYQATKYKVIFRKSQYYRGTHSPSKLSFYFYLEGNGPKLRLFIIAKNKWLKQSIGTMLMLRKIETELPIVDDHYIVRSNNKEGANRILLDENKRKMLLSFCNEGFELELNQKYLYLGEEGSSRDFDMVRTEKGQQPVEEIYYKKNRIVDILSKSTDFYKTMLSL